MLEQKCRIKKVQEIATKRAAKIARNFALKPQMLHGVAIIYKLF